MPSNKTTNSFQKSRLPQQPILLAATAIIFILVGGGIYWYAMNHHKNPSASLAQRPYSYTYAKLDNYSLSVSQAGSGDSFSKPIEFKAPTGVEFSPGQVLFAQSAPNTSIVIGGLSSASLPSSEPPTTDYLKGFNQALKNSDFAQYQPLVDSLNQYVGVRLPGYRLNFNVAQPITTDNIKSAAMNLKFTAAPTTVSQKAGFPTLQGEAILALGQRASYYFVVFSTDYNWQANQSTWQSIINSLKIDQ